MRSVNKLSFVVLPLLSVLHSSSLTPFLPDTPESSHAGFPFHIVPYEDADFGFSMAVPDGWHPIDLPASEEDFESLEPSYAVGFESPRVSTADIFADYIMVEIMPGRDTGAFETSGRHTQQVLIDGKPGVRDRLVLHDYQLGDRRVDLIVFQAELVELGYTIGFYAIGEQHEAEMLGAAFEVLLRTIKTPSEPFSVS